MAVDKKIETDLSVMIVEMGALFKFKFFRCIFIFVDPLECRPDTGTKVLGHGLSILIVGLFWTLTLVHTHILLQISSDDHSPDMEMNNQVVKRHILRDHKH